MLRSSKYVLIAASLLLFSAGAFAQASNSYDVNLSAVGAVNQCSIGEPVALSGTVHVSYSVTNNNGVNQFAITAANDLTGAGQKTGATYAAGDSDDYSSNNDDPSADVTVELKSDLKPQAGAAAMTLVQGLHIVVDTMGNITAEVVSNTTNCGD
jgi:hypothetical protein